MKKPNAPRPQLGRGVMAACALAFSCVLPAHADDVQEAQKLLKAGQSQQALERVNRAIAANSRDAQARFLKGVILTEQGRQPEAIDVFQKLTQDFPNLPEPYNNLAVIYASQGQYEKARQALEQSIRTHPSYATAYENLGDVYAKLASQAYGKALQLDASNAGAQNKLSLMRELARDPGAKPAVAKEPAKPPVVVAEKAAPPVQKAPEKPAPPAQKAPEKPAPAAEKPPVVGEKAPEKPAAKPAPAPAADPKAEVVAALNAWARAWSKQDVPAYLSHYAKDFKTPGGEPRREWEKSRRERIAAPKSISVTIESPNVTMRGANEASVSFRQTYQSDRLNVTSRKTLDMVRADGRWLIQEEKAGK